MLFKSIFPCKGTVLLNILIVIMVILQWAKHSKRYQLGLGQTLKRYGNPFGSKQYSLLGGMEKGNLPRSTKLFDFLITS